MSYSGVPPAERSIRRSGSHRAGPLAKQPDGCFVVVSHLRRTEGGDPVRRVGGGIHARAVVLPEAGIQALGHRAYLVARLGVHLIAHHVALSIPPASALRRSLAPVLTHPGATAGSCPGPMAGALPAAHLSTSRSPNRTPSRGPADSPRGHCRDRPQTINGSILQGLADGLGPAAAMAATALSPMPPKTWAIAPRKILSDR